MLTVYQGVQGPGKLQRTTITAALVLVIIAAAFTAPTGVRWLTLGVSDLLNVQEFATRSDDSVFSLVFWQVIRIIVFAGPFVSFVLVALVLWRRRKWQVYSDRFQHVEDLLWDPTVTVLQAATTLLAFGLSLGGLYAMLGIGLVLAEEETAIGSMALSLVLPVDVEVLIWALPALLLGVVGRIFDFWGYGFAKAATRIAVLCIVMACIRISIIFPIIFYGIGEIIRSLP